MDVLIKNMTLPKEGSVVIEIYSDGLWCDYKSNLHHGKAIELPPHGKLFDADTVADYFFDYLRVCFPFMNMVKAKEVVEYVKEACRIAPTVLEAST